MKIKVSEATGPVLNWLVAQCEMMRPDYLDRGLLIHRVGYGMPMPKYSTEWAQGGPIIERKKIGLLFDAGPACRGPAWFATPANQQVADGYEGESFDPTFMVNEADGCYGPTPLIAAMRCYAVSTLGDYADVPEALAHA